MEVVFPSQTPKIRRTVGNFSRQWETNQNEHSSLFGQISLSSIFLDFSIDFFLLQYSIVQLFSLEDCTSNENLHNLKLEIASTNIFLMVKSFQKNLNQYSTSLENIRARIFKESLGESLINKIKNNYNFQHYRVPEFSQ